MSRFGSFKSFGSVGSGANGLTGFWGFAEKHPFISLLLVGTVASEVGAVIRTAIGGGSKSLSIDIPGLGGVGGTLSGGNVRENVRTQEQIDDIIERLCELERLHGLDTSNTEPIDVEAVDISGSDSDLDLEKGSEKGG